MKKLLSLLILSFFIISCSEKEPVVDETPSETVDPNGDDNSGGNSDDGGAGWNGDVFSFAEVDVKSQWTFDGSQSSQGLQRITSLIEEIQINQALIDYEDSLDVGVLSIESPKTGELTSSETISVIVGNYGYLSILDSLEISLQVKFEDGEFSDPIVETIIINDSLPPVEAMAYTFNTTLDLSEKGTYYIGAITQLQDDMDVDNNSHIQVVKSLEYTDVCNIHSFIFNEDNTFKLYTNNEEGVCNYVILGEYQLDQDSSLLKLYSPDSSQETNLIGHIYDVETEDNGEFTGTIDIDGICVQIEDGYEEKNYAEGLTYIPDENLENYLIEIGKDDVIDGYVTNPQASSITEVTIEAEDNWEIGSSIGFWDFDERFSNRISNLAGIEAFPNLERINLMGQNLDSINISKNPKLKSFGANFNTFKKLDTSNNPELEWLSIDSNEVTPILDFSNNPNITMLSTPMCSIEGFIGEGGHYDISNMPDLIFLDLYDNRLTSVDISNNTKLEEIRINVGNSISTIDFSNNIFLQTVLASNSGLEGELDVSNLTELEELNIANNNISAINFSNNTKLEYLEINGNQIEGEIDVSNCTNLLEFYANYGNNLSCIIVNQDQLDAYNGINPPDGFKWELSIEPTLVCN
ncbi:MAG: leucine-rich repeat domain-containing protein [Flavobacteriaceae bacterium]